MDFSVGLAGYAYSVIAGSISPLTISCPNSEIDKCVSILHAIACKINEQELDYNRDFSYTFNLQTIYFMKVKSAIQ